MSNEVLDGYMKEHFPGLPLESPLFYNAPIGIRFELGVDYGNVEQAAYLANVQLRSAMIFDEIFDEDSNILLVINSFRSVEPYFDMNQGEEVFPKYIKNKNILSNLDCVETDVLDEETRDLCGTSRQYILKCKKKDIDYNRIVIAKSHMDFVIEPYISDEVFFINTDKHIIYYMYNDYGLDVVSEAVRSLIDIYIKFNNWILDYDRAKIQRIFEDL